MASTSPPDANGASHDEAERPGRATIRDIAARAGVSVATVSRVINGRPDVSAATREQVWQHIRQRGYTTNRSARGLAGGRSGLIGLTVPYIHAEYFNHIVSGAAQALYEHDARLVLCPTAHEHDREVTLLERLMHGTTDGGLFILPSEGNDELLHLQQSGYTFVVVDNPVPLDEAIPVVSAAQWSGARAATEHLIRLGHRRIAAITGPRAWIASIDRLAGFQSAVLEAGLASDVLLGEADFLIEGGYQVAREILSLPEPPTAIFAFNDNMAVAALQAARELGLDVPRDLSVVGFDDIEVAAYLTPPLTTVRQPLQEMGRVAVNLLFRLLGSRPVDVTRVELSTRLITRGSTAPPRSR